MKVSIGLFILSALCLMKDSLVKAVELAELKLEKSNTPVDKQFNASTQTGLFKISLVGDVAKEKYLFISVSGKGDIQVNGLQNDDSQETHLCSGENDITCSFLVSDMEKLFNSPSGFRFSAKSISSASSPITVSAYAGDHLDLKANQRQTVILKNIETLPASVIVTPLENTSKIRIMLKSHPMRKFAALNAYLNLNTGSFPSASNHDEQFVHLDSFRSAFTAYSGDLAFCEFENKTCTYRVLLETDGVVGFQVGVHVSGVIEDIGTDRRYVEFIHSVR